MPRPLTAAATSLVLLIGLWLAPVSAPAVAGKRDSPATKYADSAHSETNLVRGKRDMAGLGTNICLRKHALAQARTMAREGELSHQSMPVVAAACEMGYVGENVAYGFKSGRAVVQGWMKSPGHRANLLSTNFRVMGFGAVRRQGVWWVAQVFGRRR